LSKRSARIRRATSFAPTTSWWWKETPPPLSKRRVAGLPMSWQQGREAQDEVGAGHRLRRAVGRPLEVDRLLEHDHRVVVDVLVPVVLVDLEAQRGQLGQHQRGEPALGEQLEAGARMPGEDQLHELVAHPLGGHDLDGRRELTHRGEHLRGRHERELGDEACGTHHPQRVVTEGHLGGGGRAQHLVLEVGEPAVRVDEGEVGQPQRHGVDGEVTPDEVVLEGVAERDDRLAGLAVVGVGPVGRHLDDHVGAAGADRAELAAHVPRRGAPRREQRLGLVRSCRGREVEVAHHPPEERVAHGPADEREVVTGIREPGAEVGQRRDGRREVRHRPAKERGGGLTGGHEHQGYAARADGGGVPRPG
jgi:hypothetical protein